MKTSLIVDSANEGKIERWSN